MPKEIAHLDEVIKELHACRDVGSKTQTLDLPEFLPEELVLNQLKSVAEELLGLHDFYMGFLLSAKYSGEPLSDKIKEAMRKAGIDPDAKEEKPKPTPTKIHGLSFEELDLNDEKKRYGAC